MAALPQGVETKLVKSVDDGGVELSEADIYRRFDALTSEKTAVYISHRLSSCHFCQDIAVFDRGQLVEQGPHRELLAKGGQYARLWEAQARTTGTDPRGPPLPQNPIFSPFSGGRESGRSQILTFGHFSFILTTAQLTISHSPSLPFS
ncbi:hypothetical protein LJB68_05625 [bacterium 210820-DFI.6.52]|nr:hypothetical protein [bacterium 210820-DFI.6.52]